MAGTGAPVQLLFENFKIWIFEFHKNLKFMPEIHVYAWDVRAMFREQTHFILGCEKKQKSDIM